MRFWLDIGLIALSDHWKWVVGAATILVVVVVGTLFLGVLGSDTAAADPGPSVILEPTAVPDAISTPTTKIVDALIALRMFVGLAEEDLAMDVNKDGHVTPDDARQLLAMARQG